MKIYICILSLLLGSGTVLAQYAPIDQFVVGNLGGEITNSDYAITQSIGDLVGSKEGSISIGYIVVQGFPQCVNCSNCVKIMSVDPGLGNPLVKVFPNPATTLLTLEGEERLLHRYELYSPTGQLLKGDKLENSQLDLSNLSAGVYFLRIYDLQQQLSFSGKVLKK